MQEQDKQNKQNKQKYDKIIIFRTDIILLRRKSVLNINLKFVFYQIYVTKSEVDIIEDYLQNNMIDEIKQDILSKKL